MENQHSTFTEMWPFLPQRLEMPGVQAAQQQGLFWFHTSLVPALSPQQGEEGSGRSCPNLSCEQISTGGADSAGEPWWSQVWMRNPEWWISVLCRTHNLLDGHWSLPAPISALTSGRGDVKCAVAGRTALSITQAASSDCFCSEKSGWGFHS